MLSFVESDHVTRILITDISMTESYPRDRLAAYLVSSSGLAARVSRVSSILSMRGAAPVLPGVLRSSSSSTEPTH